MPTADNATLQSWLLAAGTGDKTAFAQLAKALGPQLHRQATRITGNATLADDVLQEVLIKLWTHAPRWQARPAGQGTVAGYASTLVFRAAMDIFRATKPMVDIEADDADVAMPETLTARIYHQERHQALLAAMQKLPARQHEAVTLAYLYENKTRDVAHMLGTTEKAADALLIRARHTLATLLPAHMKEELNT
ncbi:MAG: sigma-70 family RNA polymerase sigma factor [Alphaproteobacteria bacterium]